MTATYHLYARVSKDDLHCENQLRTLRAWAASNIQPDDVAVYHAEEMSSRKTRPIKESVLQQMRSGNGDVVVVVRIDRWARSLQELVMDVRQLVDQGKRFVAILNGFDFSRNSFNASQQLMLNIFGAFAEFEREIIRERTNEGLARAKAQGKKLGRPRKHPIKTPHVNLEPICTQTVSTQQTDV